MRRELSKEFMNKNACTSRNNQPRVDIPFYWSTHFLIEIMTLNVIHSICKRNFFSELITRKDHLGILFKFVTSFEIRLLTFIGWQGHWTVQTKAHRNVHHDAVEKRASIVVLPRRCFQLPVITYREREGEKKKTNAHKENSGGVSLFCRTLQRTQIRFRWLAQRLAVQCRPSFLF